MHEGDNRSDNGRKELPNQAPCDSRREHTPLVYRGERESISDIGASRDEYQELAYDYYTAIAQLWDNPKRGDQSINKINKE
jgi:hypothetical protein